MTAVHRPSYLMIRGHVSLYCSCGWNGGKHRSSTQAHTAWQLHANTIGKPMLGTQPKEDPMSETETEQPIPAPQPAPPIPTPDTDDDDQTDERDRHGPDMRDTWPSDF